MFFDSKKRNLGDKEIFIWNFWECSRCGVKGIIFTIHLFFELFKPSSRIFLQKFLKSHRDINWKVTIGVTLQLITFATSWRLTYTHLSWFNYFLNKFYTNRGSERIKDVIIGQEKPWVPTQVPTQSPTAQPTHCAKGFEWTKVTRKVTVTKTKKVMVRKKVMETKTRITLVNLHQVKQQVQVPVIKHIPKMVIISISFSLKRIRIVRKEMWYILIQIALLSFQHPNRNIQIWKHLL